MRPSDASAREAIALLALAAFNAGISFRCVELRVVTFGTALAGVAALACAGAWDVGSLATLRFFTALFASAPVALGMAYIGEVVPLAGRQTTVARFIAGSLAGQTLGPLFGGVLTDWVGWRTSFAALGATFLLAAAVLFMRTRGAWPRPVRGAFQPLAIHARLLARASSLVRWFIRTPGERGLVLAGGLAGAVFFALFGLLPDWRMIAPLTLGLGVAFYLIHNPVQTRATEIAPDARGSSLALYACAWGAGRRSARPPWARRSPASATRR